MNNNNKIILSKYRSPYQCTGGLASSKTHTTLSEMQAEIKLNGFNCLFENKEHETISNNINAATLMFTSSFFIFKLEHPNATSELF